MNIRLHASGCRLWTVVRIALVLLGLVLYSEPLSAQPSAGSVAGRVSASTGAGLPGATITAINAEAGVQQTAVSGSNGEYVIEDLPATGVYEIRAELDGFAPVSRTGVTLTPGGRDTISFLLIPFTTEILSI